MENPIRVFVFRRGQGNQTLQLNALTPGERRDLGAIGLSKGFSASGRVTNTQGEGIAGAVVHANGIDLQSWAEADATGAFTIAGLSEGPYSLSCRTPGYGMPPFQSRLIDEDTSDIEFQLQAGRQYEGIVVDADGSPVSHAQVYLQSPTLDSAETDANGVFLLWAPSEGSVDLSVRHHEFELWQKTYQTPDHLPPRIAFFERNTPSHRVADDMSSADTKVIQQSNDIGGDLLAISFRRVRLIALAMSTAIEGVRWPCAGARHFLPVR